MESLKRMENPPSNSQRKGRERPVLEIIISQSVKSIRPDYNGTYMHVLYETFRGLRSSQSNRAWVAFTSMGVTDMMKTIPSGMARSPPRRCIDPRLDVT